MAVRFNVIAGAMLALSTWALSAPSSADFIQMSTLGDFCGGEDTGTVCAELGQRYDTTGGGVIDPSESQDGLFLIPGTDTGDPDQVVSYNVTTSADEPPSGQTDILVTGLESSFDFYWGSVDKFNKVELLFGEIAVATFDGQDLADLVNANTGTNYQANPQGNFGFDQYVAFSSSGEREAFFNAARLSVTDEGTGVAFEVATVRAVPEPSVVAMLAAGLLGLGLLRLRHRNA